MQMEVLLLFMKMQMIIKRTLQAIQEEELFVEKLASSLEV